jgi:hypothetical protein
VKSAKPKHNNKIHTIYKQTSVFVLVLLAKQQQQKKTSIYIRSQYAMPWALEIRSFYTMCRCQSPPIITQKIILIQLRKVNFSLMIIILLLREIIIFKLLFFMEIIWSLFFFVLCFTFSSLGVNTTKKNTERNQTIDAG